MKRTRGNSSEATRAETDNAMTLSVVEKARNAPLAGDNGARSNGRSRKNECNNSVLVAEGRIGTMQPICHGDRWREKLLCLQGIQVHGLTLLK